MTNLDGCVITFPIEGGIFGVGRLATKLKALADTEQDLARGTSANGLTSSILQSECNSPPLRMVSARERPAPAQQTEFASVLMTAHVGGVATAVRKPCALGPGCFIYHGLRPANLQHPVSAPVEWAPDPARRTSIGLSRAFPPTALGFTGL